MAMRTVVTRGYGNGTFNGTTGLTVTRGYAIGAGAAVQVYMADVFVNITPALSLLSNLLPTKDTDANLSPTEDVNIG